MKDILSIETRPKGVDWIALLVGNIALALGPWFVRLSDSGPVSAGFWRLTLALPFLMLLMLYRREQLSGYCRKDWLLVIGAGLIFALALASWHFGIDRTRLGNAVLFGNSGSIFLMIGGLLVLRRRPRVSEVVAVVFALIGTGLLLGRSMDVDRQTIVGDVFCIVAALCYLLYILVVRNIRGRLAPWTLIFWSSLAGTPVMLLVAIAMGEQVWPTVWWPLIGLVLVCQIVGQGLLVWALSRFSPFIVGLALLTQPGVSVLAGWLSFGEIIEPIDSFGMALVASALVFARTREQSGPVTPGVASS